MMKKRNLATAVLATTVFAMSVPAMAEYYTTADGAIVLDITDKKWEEVEVPDVLATFTDGSCTITVEHYEADEEMPLIKATEDPFVASYQVVMADEKDVYVITGSVVAEDELADVREIVQSAVFYEDLPYAGTEEAGVNAAETTTIGGTSGATEIEIAASTEVSATDAIMYATAAGGLNIRSAASSDAASIGTYAYGESINVIGIVCEDGIANGWYQVGYKEQIGYVAAAYVSEFQPTDVSASLDDGSNELVTGEVVYVYNEDGSTTLIKEYTDGVWRDRMGYTYEATEDGHWVCQQVQE